jgi:hypothetical protein
MDGVKNKSAQNNQSSFLKLYLKKNWKNPEIINNNNNKNNNCTEIQKLID